VLCVLWHVVFVLERLPYFMVVSLEMVEVCKEAMRMLARREIGKHRFTRICGRGARGLKHREYMEVLVDIVVAENEYIQVVGGTRARVKMRANARKCMQ